MRLRPDAWEEIALSDDEEASASVSMIVALNDFYYGRSELDEWLAIETRTAERTAAGTGKDGTADIGRSRIASGGNSW